MVVLCFWEITKRDSAAEVVLAVSTVVTMLVILVWAALKVWRIAQRSIKLHKNPAYILYSDPKALNKWGFLYVQFKATMYYFIAPVLLYLLVKGMFVGLGQGGGIAQAIGFVILDAAMLIAVSVMRPYMDKKTNAFNISIAAVNFFNALLLLFFTGIFNLPVSHSLPTPKPTQTNALKALAIGVMGVLFFVINAIFALVILLMVIWASIWALVSKNPDTRYQPMRDDRGSFIKSQTNLGTTELDALGATARGDGKPTSYNTERKRMDLDDEEEGGSFEGGQSTSQVHAAGANAEFFGAAKGVETPSAPMLRGAGDGYGRTSPSPGYRSGPVSAAASSDALRSANNASPSPWQRGVGY